MSKGLKILVVLLFVASLAFLSFSMVLFRKAEVEKGLRLVVEGKLVQTQDKLDTTEKEKQELQGKYEEIIAVKEQVEEERDKAVTKASELADELKKEKQVRKELQSKLEEKQKQAEMLLKQLQEEREEGKRKEGEIMKLSSQGGSNELLEKIKKLQREKEDLEKKFKEIGVPQSGISIKPIVLDADKKFSGQVLNVNEEFQFVVINIGNEDGIVPGTELIVHRGNKLIGKVIVEKIFDKMSSAVIIPKFSQGKIEVYDSVKKF